MALTKTDRRNRIRKRIRKHISGTGETPRLSVFRSNKQIYAQIIDDKSGVTLAAASSLSKTILEKKDVNKIEQAKLVGKLIAEEAKNKGISKVVFDRGGYLYHGRIKELANAAREGGLNF
jgi:large subunit ribosomal protein L18